MKGEEPGVIPRLELPVALPSVRRSAKRNRWTNIASTNS